MSPFFLRSRRVGAALACLLAVGCSTTDTSPAVDAGTDVPHSDAPVDLGRDVLSDVADATDAPADVTSDVTVDAPADVTSDVTVDVAADVPADVSADVPADVATDVPGVADAGAQKDATADVASHPCTTFCVRGRQNCGFDCCIDPLTDARHCGDCGHACDTGLVCRDGVCAP